MAEQIGRLARMPDRDLLLGLARAHAELAVARHREQMIAQRGPDARRDRIRIGIGVDQHAALRVFGGDLPVGVAQVLMEFEVFGLEPVRRAAAATRCGALQADLDGDVENDGQVRLEIADGDPLHGVEHAGRDLPQPALIGAGRIREAVAQHPGALAERGLDHGADMVVAGGREQQRLRIGPEQLAHARQHQMPDDFGARRSAGLAGDDGAQLCRVKTLGELLDLRGFSGALAAFKGDELPASGRSVQRCLSHAQSFSALARNMPMTSSLAPSIARRMVEPVPIASAA